MNFRECLPREIAAYVATLNPSEVRLRNGNPARINVNGKWYWVGKNALETNPANAVVLDDVCDTFVKNACNGSVYAYEKMLAQGFFTLSDGTRIGVCGIVGSGSVFQKYTSVCIRTARYFACADQTLSESCIVVGAPRSGKTTYLRDFACRLSHEHNVVVVDERGELSNCNGFKAQGCCDVLQYATKRYGFEVAVRTMSPDWIVCDELSADDLQYVPSVVACGVKLAASVHASDLTTLTDRLKSTLDYFSYAVFLQQDTFAQRVVDLRNLRQNTPETPKL